MNADTFLRNFGHLADAPSGIDQLRTLVLQLAFTGKLDGDASAQDAASWTQSTVDSITAEIVPGFACSKKHEDANGHVHLRTHNVGTDGRLNFDLLVKIAANKVDERKAALRKDDVIFNNTNSQELVGKTCIVDNDYDFAFSNHLTILRFIDDIEPGFIVRYFNLLLRTGVFSQMCNRWIGQAGINTKMLKAIVVRFPSIDQQRRILKHIEDVFALCDELEARQQERRAVHVHLNGAALDHLTSAENDTDFEIAWTRVRSNFDLLYSVPENVNALRQTILQLAVQGKLVEQDETDEPASLLLKRITGLKGKAHAEGLIQKDKKFAPTTASSPPWTVPDSWEWVRLQDLFEVVRGGSPRPAGDPRYFGGSIPWITVREITKDDDVFLRDTRDGITELGSKRSRFIRPNDLLLTNSGATLGVPKISTITGCINDGVALLKCFHDQIDLEYAYYYLRQQTPAFRAVKQGMGQPNLNTPILAGWYFPLPPLFEQSRIVEYIQKLDALCDELEAKLTQKQADADSLTEAMVAAVFAGEVKPPAPMTTAPARPRSPKWPAEKPTVARRRGYEEIRGAVSSYAVKRLHRQKSFHRTKHAKILSMAQAHVGVDLGIAFERWDHGPFHPCIYEVERLAARKEWYETTDGEKVAYSPGPKIGEQVGRAEELLGDRQAEMDRLLDLFSGMRTRRAELIATTFFVWNDLLIDGATADESEIADEFFRWHESKRKKFTPVKVAEAIEWLRDNDMVPTGKGHRTTLRS
ncbi:MAG: hypothetical protein DWQ34_25800 [Planctomycetota bacterium]|nr:MAG: hypothetical protein DWQ34_25800 [Planctomycetota bacterium]REK29736.1 MAG: hypothetical protein DWQ41_03605 [Planctomycetota bacterium]REK30443.1 MAG: hypothetical protein DWQ45_21430 [Planctomycetota bacterium]